MSSVYTDTEEDDFIEKTQGEAAVRRLFRRLESKRMAIVLTSLAANSLLGSGPFSKMIIKASNMLIALPPRSGYAFKTGATRAVFAIVTM